MNGAYFDALMRSSGLGVAAPAPMASLAPVEAPPGVQLEGLEMASEVMAVPVPTSTPAPQAHVAQAEAVEPLPAFHDAAGAARPSSDAPHASADVPTSAGDDSPSRTATHVIPAPPSISIGQTLARAALQWVAADPLNARDPHAVRAMEEHAPALPARQLAPRDAADATAPVPQRIATDAQASQATAPSIERTVLLPPPPAQLLAPPPQRAPAATWREPPAAPAREEMLEVSIGAIHLRVDAPAVQAIAKAPAAPPGTSASRPASFAPRSALSRRALRRI